MIIKEFKYNSFLNFRAQESKKEFLFFSNLEKRVRFFKKELYLNSFIITFLFFG